MHLLTQEMLDLYQELMQCTGKREYFNVYSSLWFIVKEVVRPYFCRKKQYEQVCISKSYTINYYCYLTDPNYSTAS